MQIHPFAIFPGAHLLNHACWQRGVYADTPLSRELEAYIGHRQNMGKGCMCRYTILPYFAELTYSIMHVGRKAYVQIHPLAVNCKEISDTHRYGKKMYVADTPLCHISRSSLAQSLCWKKGVSCRYTFLPKTVEHS